jgi:hypothetical protein
MCGEPLTDRANDVERRRLVGFLSPAAFETCAKILAALHLEMVRQNFVVR